MIRAFTQAADNAATNSTAKSSWIPGWRPGALVTRMSALVIAVGGVSFFIHLAVMSSLGSTMSGELAQALGQVIRLERAALSQAATDERSAVAAALGSARHRIVQAESAQDLQASQPGLPLANQLIEMLRKQVDPDVRVGLLSSSGSFFPDIIAFEFEIDGKPWRIEHRPDTPGVVAIGGFVGWLLLLAAAVIACLLIGVRLVARPLSALSRQVLDQSRVLRPLEITSGASDEVREFVKAFNTLAREKQSEETMRQHMLAGVSHDMRSPLARLRLRVEMQCQGDLADEISADLYVLERIVSQFLSFVQGELHSGFGEPWSIAEVAHRVVESHRNEVRSIAFQTDGTHALAPDVALQRALNNLIDNAITYGVAPVEVQLQTLREEDRDEVWLTVWDRGFGMSDEDFIRAQAPFERLRPGHDPMGHFGLGLAIVRQIALHTGGRLALRRESGRFGIALCWPMKGRS